MIEEYIIVTPILYKTPYVAISTPIVVAKLLATRDIIDIT